MATWTDVRRIGRSLPGVHVGNGGFGLSVLRKGKHKGFAWVWLERTDPKKPRLPNPAVIAVRVRDQSEKAALLAGDPERFFTEPHYNGFPAVLVRLAAVTGAQLRQLLVEGWRCHAPRDGSKGSTPARPVRRTTRKRARRSREASR
jgi:hypothetical protein